VCLLIEDFWGKKEKETSFFNAQKRSLVLVLLLCEDDDDECDFRFGRRISFSLSRGESGRYRKKTFFFFSWSRQENSGHSWGEKRQTTTAE
jgi:hypothetical protein